MKKIAIIITSLLFLILSLSYLLLFTPAGNDLLKPRLEEKINQNSPLKIKLSEFVLDMQHLRLFLKLDEDNSIVINGTYSLFSRDFDIDYSISLKKLSRLETVIKRRLEGKFLSEGVIKGNINLFKIKGKSDLAESQTDYSIVIADMQLEKAAIKVSDARLQTLLSMLGEKPYAAGKINLHVQLTDLDPQNMKGSIALAITQASLNAKTLKKELGFDLDKTNLQGEFKAKLEGSEVDYLAKVSSEIINIDSKGKLLTKDNVLSSNYRIDIKELALFKSITHSALRGAFYTEGKIWGEKESYRVQGKSNIADSNTNYTLDLHEMKPTKLLLTVKGAKLENILYIVGEPSYAKGNIDLNIDLKTVIPLSGKTDILISEGLLNNNVVKESFDIQFPHTRFKLKSKADITDGKVSSSTTLDSNLASLNMTKTQFDIKTVSLTSDYSITIPSLEKFEPILERKLYGEMIINGDISKNKHLDITAHSKAFQGQIKAKLHDEQLNSEFNDLRAIGVLKMLGYPEILDASTNGNLVYNTKTKKGKLDTQFDKATLTRSQMTDLISKLTRSDLSKEHFNKGTLTSIIDKEIITSELDMQSKDASLKSKKFVINSKKQTIDARFSVKIKKDAGDILVQGAINDPSVRLDAKSMITPEVKEKLNKEINRFLKKLF